MTELTTKFFSACIASFNRTVYTNKTSPEMMASPVDTEGWFEWKLMKGTLQEEDYRRIEKEFKVQFPKSFIEWHKQYFFENCDCSIARFSSSLPIEPLAEIKRSLNWFIPEQLIPQKLYPFANDGNDSGHFVFDGRYKADNNEFPIRIYDQEFGGDLNGLSEIVFSSFKKMIECLTHYMEEMKSRKNFEIIPDFFQIDKQGAGKSGIDYWLGWISMQKANFEEFGD